MVKQRKGLVKEELIMPLNTTEPKSNMPTPEQMRIAQILEKRVVDTNIKLKLKQIMDATQRSVDEVYVALHDSDFDVNRAVNLLIEGEDHLADWCTNDKRKKKLAELKEKKEVLEAEVPQPEKMNSSIGRRGNKERPGHRQDKRPTLRSQQDEPRKPLANSESRALKGKRPGTAGFGSMVFERSNPQPIAPSFPPPVKNQWEKPLLRTNGPRDDWDCEEFQGSLSQTQIFTSSKRHEPKEIMEEQKASNVPIPCPMTSLASRTFTTNTSDQCDSISVCPATHLDKCDDIRQGNSIRTQTIVKASQDKPCVIPANNKVHVLPSQHRKIPSETRAEYAYQLPYPKSSHHEDRRPPSKIPTLPVEMPPELKPSLSFLDIQFGAMDLCPLETSSESQTNLCNSPLLNPTLMPPTAVQSGCSITNLEPSVVANASANSSPLTSSTCTTSPGICSTTIPPGMNGMSNSPGINNIASLSGLNNSSTPVDGSSNSIANTSHNSLVNPSNSIASPNMSKSNGIQYVNPAPLNSNSGSITHLIGQSNMQQTGADMAISNNMPNTINYGSSSNQRFIPSSQTFNGSHMQYGLINPPVSSHGFDSRDPPPHLPPFKSPPGIPKGNMVPNLPPGSLMNNQYIVGQGNVPYFAHPSLYYYEEVPPAMNTPQRLPNMASHPHHFDVAYQGPPSSRDSVHYNA